ncbi:Bug family tripartite tricarboxylate transporter substrate binding protein [Amphibiibacter pelophylacis]|uniref:Tripartite tricarboxylate transporter substrate binding protein n=1 Tax=Amphibiibacter pelophylacis TaxID=1799477 RepID=A0ACC6P1F7_9BURK
MRRTFLKSMLLGGVGASPLAAALLGAQSVQAAETLKFMVPSNPGGGWDTTARALGKSLQEAGLYSAVTYENKGGASGTLGLAQFLNASKGDPNALMMMGAVMLGGIISSRSPFSVTQATPVARLTSEYNVFVVPAESPIKSMKDLVDQLRKDPGSVKWGGGIKGSTEHVAAAMIARFLGLGADKINYIPFKGGGEATAAILGNNVTVGGSGYSEFQQYIESGKMRAIGITADKRQPGINVPTLKEQGVDVVIGNWRGVYAAPGVTPAQREALTQAVIKATQTPSWKEALQKNSWTPALLTGKAFDDFVTQDFASLRAIMVKSGMLG